MRFLSRKVAFTLQSPWSGALAGAFMSTVLRFFNKPEYFFQPRAVVSRLMSRGSPDGVVIAPLPWGISIEVDPLETIGRSLTHRGMFELAVVEAMFRLIEPGDLVLDVGANIGFMSAAAACSHADIEVIAYEPHPELFRRLLRNRDRWVAERPGLKNRIRLVEAAVSEHPGTATLHIPDNFAGNQGIASLVGGNDVSGTTALTVATAAIDDIVDQEGRDIGLLKIDIEGHELAAFRGAARALRHGKIRNIVFEDHQGIASNAARFLASHGYELYFLSKLPWRPVMCEPASAAWAASISFDSPNLLATREPKRARERMKAFGYRCLS